MEKLSRFCFVGVILYLLVGTNGYEREISGAESHNVKLECWRNPVDIVLVLDSSRSIWGPDFKKQLEFVKNLVDQLDIGMGATQTRLGLIMFSTWAQIEISLYESSSKEELKRRIDKIQRLYGDTNTGDALRLLRKEAFKPKHGSRPWVRHIGIILTDGESQDKTITQTEARACKDAKIELFAIGIGDKVSYHEVRGIASFPKSKFFILTSNYDALDRIRQNILKKTCQTVVPETTTRSTTPTTRLTTTMTPSTTPSSTFSIPIADEECKGRKADVFFLLDSSSSIRIDEFLKQVNVIENMVRKFDIGPLKTRVGVSVFSHEYYSKLKFDDSTDKEEILDIISDIRYLGGGTNTGKALLELRNNEFNSQSVRPGVDKVIILFTDGQSADAHQASFEARLLKESGVKIFAVGIGPYIDLMELEDIASRPSEDFVHTFETFDILLTKSGFLSKKTCTVDGQILVKEQDVCNATQMTDVMFLVSDKHFGKEKTDRILKASAEVVRRVGSRGAFRFGTLFEECPPREGVKIGSTTEERYLVNEIVGIQYGPLSAFIRQLRIDEFSPWDGVRNVAMLFLDNTINLDDPQLQLEIKRAFFKGILFYAVVIDEGVDLAQVEKAIAVAPKERIIVMKSYNDLVSKLPFSFTNALCTRETNPDEFKPEIS